MDELIGDLIIFLIREGFNGFRSFCNSLYDFYFPRSGSREEPEEESQSPKPKKEKESNKKEEKREKERKRGGEQHEHQYSSEKSKASNSAKSGTDSTTFGQIFAFLFITINQGYLGVVFNHGVLSPNLLEPGLHFQIPFYQSIKQVSISPETTRITNVQCGTSTGLSISFDKIEIVTQLNRASVYPTIKQHSFDYHQILISSNARHKMTEICSRYTLEDIYINKFDKLDEELSRVLKQDLKKWIPGLLILDIRITKPSLPARIQTNYEEVERIKGKLLLVKQQEKTVVEKLQTAEMKLIKQAESDLEVRSIELQKYIEKKKNEYEMELIQSATDKQSNFTIIDNEYLVSVENCQAFRSTLTKQFLRKHLFQSMSQGTVFVGDSQPTVNIKI